MSPPSSLLVLVLHLDCFLDAGFVVPVFKSAFYLISGHSVLSVRRIQRSLVLLRSNRIFTLPIVSAMRD